jgi:parvulin-like peptidyl-prolyl isomerase
MRRTLCSAAVAAWSLAGVWAYGAQSPASPATAAPTAVVLDAIAIRVGSEIVTRVEIEEPLRQLRERLAQQFRGAELEAKMKQARDQHLKRLVEDRLLLLEARAQALEAPDAQVQERVKQQMDALRAQYPTEAEFQKQLAIEHLTVEDLQAQQETMIREQMLRQRLYQMKLQELGTASEISEAQLQKYYADHQEEFRRPARANISQIFVGHPDAGLPAKTFETKDAQARAKIEQARGELKAGRPFAAVARKYSEHAATAEKGGEVGWLAKGEVGLPEFDREVFEKLKPGETSGVLNTARGFFLVRVEDRQEGSLTPFEEVRGRIRQMLMAEGSETRLQAWIDQLKLKYPVVYEGVQAPVAGKAN